MKRIMKISLKISRAYRSVFCISLIFLAGCDHATEETSNNKKFPKLPVPIEFSNPSSESNLIAIEAEQATLATSGSSTMKIDGTKTYINFSDKTACQWTPSICSSSFVVWPGYIQYTGGYNEFGYAWMSYGPNKGFISYNTGSHYHILGLFSPADEPNPAATAMFGTDWFAFYMQNDAGRINFDLTQINVRGTVPITLWFKTATGSWMYWRSLNPGRWNLPGATNIQELHIRATSADANDKYSIDDILVKSV